MKEHPAWTANGHAGNGRGELVTVDFGGLGRSYRALHRHGRWREHFWRAQLRIALRFNHPRFYGLSPCEADPLRLAGDRTARTPRRRLAVRLGGI